MSEIPNGNVPPTNPTPPSNRTGTGFFTKVANVSRTVYGAARRTAAIVGVGTIVVGYVYLANQYKSLVELSELPNSMVLKLSLDNGIKEHHQPGRYDVSSFTGVTSLTLRDLSRTIDFAIKDERVKALYVELPDYRAVGGLAQIQELKEKIVEFQQANKIAVVYSNEYNQYNYYLASSFSKLFMLPVGHLWLTGLHNSTLFYKDIFEKLGVVPKFAHAGDFKTAPNIFTQRKFTPEHRQQVEGILLSVYSQLLQGISTSRNVTVEELNNLVNSGPHFAVDAKNNKLVDGLFYEDEVLDALKTVSGNGEIIPFRRYSRLVSQANKLPKAGAKIALIYAVGTIVEDFSESPEPGLITPKYMAKAFNDAIEDTNVKAIVLRMDSPGGSAVASDAIWRHVIRAQKAGKKVIASVGNVAASGGYYIIAPCDKILAQPGSITGSIGVFGGKFIIRNFLEKLGITEDSIKIGENSDVLNFMDDFTPAQWEQFQKSIDHTYDIFLNRVSEGRKIEKNSLLHIAGGRVFTGEQAKQIGLIDEFGGLDKAIQIAKEMVEEPSAHVHVYPRKLGFFKQLQQIRDGENAELNVSMMGILAHEMREMWGNSFGVQPWLFTNMLAKPTVLTLATSATEKRE